MVFLRPQRRNDRRHRRSAGQAELSAKRFVRAMGPKAIRVDSIRNYADSLGGKSLVFNQMPAMRLGHCDELIGPAR